MNNISYCGHDIYEGHQGCDDSGSDNEYRVVWEGFPFTVITDGVNTVKELLCHGDYDEFLRHTYMLNSDDDLSTVIYRETGCDFDFKETEVCFA